MARPSGDFSTILHQIRTDELRKTSPVEGVMVSVGCNGAYYFDWIHENLCIPSLHIGLEYYTSEPDMLPGNVQWISNTAGNMSGVTTSSVDLVFAGQTIEHLWSDELFGFLLEASRVLRLDGRLILDSPNERLTDALRWNHPEHTIELRPREMQNLLELCGFEVLHTVGHWLCRNPETNDILPLAPSETDDEWPAARRVDAARDDWDGAFSWWIEARRTSQAPKSGAVWQVINELWATRFRQRVLRMMQSQSGERTMRAGEAWATGPAQWSGALVFGPRCPLQPGQYLIAFRTDPYIFGVSPGTIEVFCATEGSERVITTEALPPSTATGVHVLPLQVDETLFGLEFRLWVNGVYALSAWVGVDIYRNTTAPVSASIAL